MHLFSLKVWHVPGLTDEGEAAASGFQANGDHSFINDEPSLPTDGASVALELPSSSNSPPSSSGGGNVRGNSSSSGLPVPRLGFGVALHCFPHGRGVSTNALHLISAAATTASASSGAAAGMDNVRLDKRNRSAAVPTLATARLISVGADLCVRHWVLVPAAAASSSHHPHKTSDASSSPLQLVLLSATRLESNKDTPYVPIPTRSMCFRT